MAVARGLAIVKPDEPFLVKLCNFGKDQVIVRKNSTLGFAEPYQGPMLAAVLDDNNPKDGTDTSSDDASRDPLEDLDLSEAPEYLHKQIRDMLKTHSSMWDGTLGVIRATQHAIVTPPDALPIRAQPYRTEPFKRQIIADQINKMLKLNVIAPSHSAWASPTVIVKDVDTVLHRLREAGVTLNLEECTWFSDEVEYLGQIVRPGQLHVHEKNVDALKHAKFPTTKTQLKSFLGMCNVYRRFVKDFAKRAKPLNALTRAEIPPDLPPPTDVAVAAFEDLRNALVGGRALGEFLVPS